MQYVRMAAIFLVLFAAVAFADYSQEWQVQQNFYDYGILYFDYNHDGSAELTKMWGNTVTAYDGSSNYSVLWYLEQTDYDELCIWDIYDDLIEGQEIALFFADNVVDETSTRFFAFEVLGDTPVWSSNLFDGYYSYISVKDIDADGAKEIVFGLNIYNADDEDYTSHFYVLNGQTGALEYTSPEFAGYMRGPFLNDMDDDGVIEILLNIYNNTDQTSELIVYSDDSQGVIQTEDFLPRDITLHSNFPNPFNPGTTIPITLQLRAEVRIAVYDILGREITVLMDGTLGAGTHQFYWNGRNDAGIPLASGAYFYEVKINGQHLLRKAMVLLK